MLVVIAFIHRALSILNPLVVQKVNNLQSSCFQILLILENKLPLLQNLISIDVHVHFYFRIIDHKILPIKRVIREPGVNLNLLKQERLVVEGEHFVFVIQF